MPRTLTSRLLGSLPNPADREQELVPFTEQEELLRGVGRRHPCANTTFASTRPCLKPSRHTLPGKSTARHLLLVTSSREGQTLA